MINKLDSQLITRFKAVSKICALLVFLIGSLATVGWEFDIINLKTMLPGLPVVAPNTAVSFIIVSLIIFVLSFKNRNRVFVYGVYFFSALITLLGVFTLTEYISGRSFGIDNWMFAGKMGDKIVRMSPQSALNFFAIGLSFIFFNNPLRKSRQIGQWILLVAGIVAFVSLAGFVYNLSNLYTIAPFKGMAVHTAIAFLLVFVSLLLFHSDEGFLSLFVKKSLNAIAARRLLFALIVVFFFEILVTLGRRGGLYGEITESLIHLLIVGGIFFFLMFFSFRSLDQLVEAEQSMEHLRELDSAKTEFVSLASHQLRTPLTSASWFTEMLLRGEVGDLNPKQKEYLLEIEIANRRMIDLVDDLLNASRIDMGTLSLDFKNVDIRETVGSLIQELDPLISEKGIQIEKDFDESMPELELDPELTRVIFQNLLSNAVKYTPAGGSVRIKIYFQKSVARVEIADNGYGIQKNQQKKVFTKLFRADNIRNKVTDGTGLGLYITKAIVEQSGGKISFQSEEGKGTTFFVSLPQHPQKKRIRQK